MTLATPRVSTGFNRHMGIELTEWSAEGAVGHMLLHPEMLNSNDMVHGGVFMTLRDFGCGIAGCYVPPGTPPRRCVTLSLTTNFLASAREGELTVRARRTGGGKRVFFAEAGVSDAAGRVLATATGAFRYIASQDRGDTSQPPTDRASTEDMQ